jgi:dolichol-phosphate mannosyltransferase
VGLVLGSRWVPHGEVVNWPLRRLLLSRAGNAYAGLALHTRVRDATGGFRAYRRETLLEIDLDQVESQGYCFQVDMLRRTLDTGHAVVEVPIRFVERERGVSKMSSSIIAEALWRVTVWGVRRRLQPGTTHQPARARLNQPAR